MKAKILNYLMLLILSLAVVSCDSDDEPASNDLVGTWYGTRTYYNPASGMKYQYLTISFESNGTGSLECETPVSYFFAKFTYKVKKGTITCTGVSANNSGDVSSNFSMTLSIKGDRIIPIDRFTLFILTKDNSVITDGDGNEVAD